ncbi:MAG TPA: VWA domain-containing protein [Vicinamibacterales bacterium]|nr:VWA domain-containing protein [Vicinamibacterales bacterium]
MKVLIAALACLAASASALAQELPPVADLPSRPMFRSTAAVVSLNVTVQDRSAKYVAGLQPADFAVYEDGVKQEVRFFESSTVPLDLIVLIDTSSSMTDKIGLAQDAAAGFLGTLRDIDRGAVVSFSDTVSILEPLTSNRAALQRAVRSTVARGKTALNTALYVALRQFGQRARSAEAVRRQAIVLLSDGADTASPMSQDDVLRAARRSGVSVYTVSLQPAERTLAARVESDESDRALQALARETGGASFFPRPDQLRSVYRAIATELANQYSIGYVPSDERLDSRFRRIVVQVLTGNALRSRTRLGYATDER